MGTFWEWVLLGYSKYYKWVRHGQEKDEAILEAIKDSGGIMSTIARKLGVTWHTADSWIRESGELMEALKDEKETILDMADNPLPKRIKEGDEQSASGIYPR